MSVDCHCERAAPTSPLTATIKICECECECECESCIEDLYSKIKAAPKQWRELEEQRFAQTPLHEAAALGQTTLAVEIMNLMPSFGSKLNPQGLSPLHAAVCAGKAETALALAKLDKQLVQVKGRRGLTPLHCAAALKGFGHDKELKLLAGLLAECPEAMTVLNNRHQSAVHVALQKGNEEAARLLVNWLVIVARESDLSIKDDHGNTTLHVAARYCHHKEVLKQLIKLVIYNKENKYGETPLDMACYYKNSVAKEMLEKAGAIALQPRGPSSLVIPEIQPSTMVNYLSGKHADRWAETLTRAYYFITKELTMEMRNTILVVAVLIATTTYQGVLQPPGGVYSAEGSPIERLDQQHLQKHPPGRMVMGTIKYSYFMPTNTLAFISSTLIIIFVLPDRAFIMILQACLIFMCVSYLLALNFISYYNSFSKILDFVCGGILGAAFLLKLGYYFIKAYYNEDEWLLRRLGVMISNHFGGTTRKRKGQDMSMLRRMRQQYKLISKRDLAAATKSIPPST